MARRGREVLGKGIHALIAEYPQESPPGAPVQIVELALDDIQPSPHQPRAAFDETRLKELAASIREKGILQPVVVNQTAPGTFHLIAGERRWRAARLAGIETVPAVVRQIDSAQELIELALVENIQREDLNPIEEAEGYRALMNTCLLTQEDIAARVGKDRSSVANALRLLKLPAEIQEHLRQGELQMGHARALVTLEAADALALGRRCIQERMTVRDLEKLARGLGKGRKRRKGPMRGDPGPAADPAVSAFEDKLRHRYATAVAIHRTGPGGRGRRGRIELEFYDDDDLERILDLMLA